MSFPSIPARKTRAVFLLFSTLFLSAKIFAERVTLQVNGYGELEKTTVPLSFEWQESWFEQSSFNYNHDMARILGALATVAYTDCSAPSSCLMTQAYSRLGVRQNDIEFFYNIDYNNEEYGVNQSAFSFAAKKTAGGRDLLFVVVRGTPVTSEEWISNLNVNDSGAESITYHEGFFLATTQLRKRFDEFIKARSIDLANSILVVTGHSRGAAIANLFSALIADDGLISTDRIFCYAFATPNVTCRSDVSSERYNFIWNIINGEDLVPTLPPVNDKWNFHRFGNTRILVNSWNCNDFKTYLNTYIPKMNGLYYKFLGRDFFPFNTGTFIGTKFSDTMAGINKDSKKYYKSFFPLHKRFSKIVNAAFPTQEEFLQNPELWQEEPAGGLEKIIGTIKRRSDTRTRVLIDYALNAFVDMHAMQEYLSWIFTLSEEEAFSEQQSTIVRINGNFNGAVIDRRGRIYARIYDGVLELRETKAPLAAWQIPIGNFGPVYIGFPSREDFSLLIYKDSLLPTPIRVRIDRYSSDGIFAGTISKKIAAAHSGIVYSFATGQSALLKENGSEPDYEKLRFKEAKLAIKDGHLKNTDVSHMNFEAHIDTEGILELGMTSGLQKFYIEMLAGTDLNDVKSMQTFSLGCGTQHAFCGPFMLNAEALLKFAHYKAMTDEEWLFTLVPAMRFLLSIKPAKRFQFFAGTEFKMYFEGMNSQLFDSYHQSIPSIGNGDFRIYPSIQFGLKL